MAKYSKDKIKQCAAWVAENGLMLYGGALLKDFCKEMDISQETYYQWMKESEFSEAIKNAQKTFKDGLEHKIVKSLAKTAIGYEWTQNTSTYIGKKLAKKVVKTMHETPNVGASIFLLTNIAPERWKNSQSHELTGEVSTGLKIVVESKEDKELIEKLGDLK